MNEPVRFHLDGEPQGKGRARAFRRGNYVGMYTPDRTRSYEGMIRFAAQQAMNGRAPIEGPVRVILAAEFSIPKSYSLKKRRAALDCRVLPAKKPDIDNVIKAWVDAMNGVVFRDDCQIVESQATKIYGAQGRVAVQVVELA